MLRRDRRRCPIENAVERIGRADRRLRVCDASAKVVEQLPLAGVGADEMKCMHRRCLSDAIDAADALFEPHRIPGQLEIHDRPAGVVQIQAF